MEEVDATGNKVTLNGVEYTVAITTDETDNTVDKSIVITNSYTPGVTSVTLTKTWEDNADVTHRPNESVFSGMVHLRIGEIEITNSVTGYEHMTKSVTNNGDGTYTVTWGNLQEKKDGETINYTVTEDADLSGFYDAGTPEYNPETGKWEVTNSLKKGSLKITKQVTVGKESWSDNTQASLADGTYTFCVYSDSTCQTQVGDDVSITITNGQAVTVEVEDLTPGTYYVKEVKSSNAAVDIEENAHEVVVAAGVTGDAVTAIATITNDYPVTSIPVKKIWQNDGIPSYVSSVTIGLYTDSNFTTVATDINGSNEIGRASCRERG